MNKTSGSRPTLSTWWSSPTVPCRGSSAAVLETSPSGSRRAISRSQEWSDPAKAPAGQGLRSRQGVFRVPDRAPRRGGQSPSRVDLLLVSGGIQGRTGTGRLAGAGQPPRLSPDRHDANLALDAGRCLLNGRTIDRIELPDDAADARGVLSHLASVEHGSHGELVDGKTTLNDRDRALWPPASRSFFVWPSHRIRPTPAACASSGHRPANCRWIRPWRSTRATRFPPTWALTPRHRPPFPHALESRGLVRIEELFAIASQQPVGVDAGQLDEAQD